MSKIKFSEIELSYAVDPTKETKVICDETNNSEEDIDKGNINVDLFIPVIPMYNMTIEVEKEPVVPEPKGWDKAKEEGNNYLVQSENSLKIPPMTEKEIEDQHKKILSSVGIPKHQLNIPEDNDGGIGQGGL